MTDSLDLTAPDDVDNSLWYLVSRYARPHALRYAVAGLLTLLAQVPQRAPAFVLGIALDAILLDTKSFALPGVPGDWIPGTASGQAAFTVGVLVLAYGLDTGFTWVAGRVGGTARFRTLHDVRVDTFDAAVGREMAFFDDAQTGDVMSVLNNDVGNLSGFANRFFEGLRFLTQLLVAFVFVFVLHWQLALVLLLMPVLLAGASYWYTEAVEPRYDAVRESVGTVNSRLEDSIDGIATVKTFTREDDERAAVAAVSAEYKERKWAVIRLRLAYNLVSWLLNSLVFIAVFAVGAALVLGEPAWLVGGLAPLTAGTLLTFLLYAKSFYMPVRRLMLEVLDSYENALASSKRIVSLLAGSDDRLVSGEADRREPPEGANGADPTVSAGRVEYDDVSFAYDGDDGADSTVTDISFAAEPGSLVGLVGPTGAGKSTVTKLLFRFYDPDSGAVQIDGTDVTEASRRRLRDHLGYVSQDPFLFYGTVRENVAYGATDPDEDAVVRAAKRAGAHEFVTDLDDGYDTQVGERGESLSGGQRQRIAIARALYRDPAILVLDEATSHVDNETERQIQESIDALSGERTTIAVAHRLSTVRNADLIVVLDDGEVVEQGTHEELLATDGLYADLWRVQVGDTEDLSEEFVDAVAAGEVSR